DVFKHIFIACPAQCPPKPALSDKLPQIFFSYSIPVLDLIAVGKYRITCSVCPLANSVDLLVRGFSQLSFCFCQQPQDIRRPIHPRKYSSNIASMFWTSLPLANTV